MKEIVFHQKLLEKAYFIFKITDAAMVRPASSDFWKAPLDSGFQSFNGIDREQKPQDIRTRALATVS